MKLQKVPIKLGAFTLLFENMKLLQIPRLHNTFAARG